MKVTGDSRQTAIAHAKRTTGTILLCDVGVFSGDGKRSLDPRRMYSVAEETKRFLHKHCVRFTGEEHRQAEKRSKHQEFRLARLAKLAIDAGKYDSARRLVDMAESAHDHWREFSAGKRVMYRIAS